MFLWADLRKALGLAKTVAETVITQTLSTANSKKPLSLWCIPETRMGRSEVCKSFSGSFC